MVSAIFTGTGHCALLPESAQENIHYKRWKRNMEDESAT